MYSLIPSIQVIHDKRGNLVKEFGLYSKFHKTCISYYPYKPYKEGENYKTFLASVYYDYYKARIEKYK